MLRRLRDWIADDLDRLAVVLWGVAHGLRPVDERPRCPDCQIGPDVSPEDCTTCRDIIETKRRDEAIMASAYDQGYEAAGRSREGEGSW
jgi:hypothetical protein